MLGTAYEHTLAAEDVIHNHPASIKLLYAKHRMIVHHH